MEDSKSTRTYEGLKSLDEYLEEEGIREEVTALAIKRIAALQASCSDGASPSISTESACSP